MDLNKRHRGQLDEKENDVIILLQNGADKDMYYLN